MYSTLNTYGVDKVIMSNNKYITNPTSLKIPMTYFGETDKPCADVKQQEPKKCNSCCGSNISSSSSK